MKSFRFSGKVQERRDKSRLYGTGVNEELPQAEELRMMNAKF